ncbi:MAG: TetR family transcriptional regulator C-terminal domain-containing protein [Cyanobacteria bacterium P01_D01_bin.105]
MVKRTRKREELIRVGRDLIVRKGFNATGLSDILAAAAVPKGSFYYYFESKEDFGLSVMEDAAKSYQQRLEATLGNEQLLPLTRLHRYFAQGIADMEANYCEEGCLFGNLAQEMSAQNPVFRDRLNALFLDWETRLSDCLQAAHNSQQISFAPTTELSRFILSGWQGAMLRAKVASSPEPLYAFTQIVFEQILKAPMPHPSGSNKSAAS